MAASVGSDASLATALVDHPQDVLAAQSIFGDFAAFAGHRAKQGSLQIVANSCGFEISVDEFFGFVMGWNVMKFPAFFVEPNPGSSALRVVVANLHLAGGAHASEGVEKGSDDGPISQANQRCCLDE